jgi:hypothetical protein
LRDGQGDPAFFERRVHAGVSLTKIIPAIRAIMPNPIDGWPVMQDLPGGQSSAHDDGFVEIRTINVLDVDGERLS